VHDLVALVHSSWNLTGFNVYKHGAEDDTKKCEIDCLARIKKPIETTKTTTSIILGFWCGNIVFRIGGWVGFTSLFIS
jgi:hypothetical protein